MAAAFAGHETEGLRRLAVEAAKRVVRIEAAAIEKVMRNQPAVFLKLLVLLVPREHKVEHSNAIKDMTDEQIERSIEVIKQILAEREAGATAKLIEGEAEVVPSLPAPGSGGTKT